MHGRLPLAFPRGLTGLQGGQLFSKPGQGCFLPPGPAVQTADDAGKGVDPLVGLGVGRSAVALQLVELERQILVRGELLPDTAIYFRTMKGTVRQLSGLGARGHCQGKNSEQKKTHRGCRSHESHNERIPRSLLRG